MKSVLLYTHLLFVAAMLSLQAQSALFVQSPDAEYVAGKLYVKLNEQAHQSLPDVKRGETPKDYPLLGNLFAKFGIVEIYKPFRLVPPPFFTHTYELVFTHTDKTEQLLRELNNLPEVAFAERVPLDRIMFNPNDPLEDNAEQPYLSLINAYGAWDISLGMPNIVLAVCDDGVRITHEDLAANIWTNTAEIPNNGIDDDGNGFIDDYNGWDFADNDNNPNPPETASAASFSHGTHCAGNAAAATNNNVGLASLAGGVKIMPLKAAANSTNNSTIITHGWQGIEYAIQMGANVISISWGSTAYSAVQEALVNYAYNQGIIIVAAAGNANTDQPFYPATYGPVISVAACENSGIKANYSNYGIWVDITAPGSLVKSCLATSNSAYGTKSGTSMASPIVAGLCALMLSANPTLTPAQLQNCLFSSATDINALNPGFSGKLGAGIINAQAAMQCAAPNTGCMAPFNLQTTAIGGTTATLNWSVVPNANYYTLRYKTSGTTDWETVNTSGNSYVLIGLSSCTAYEFQVSSNCNSSQPSEFANSYNFSTTTPETISYCSGTANSCANEWIAQVAINTLLNTSQGSNGYQNHTCATTTLNAGSNYAVLLTPGFSGNAFNEYWRIWIDYNQNGSFDDADELAFEPGLLSAGVVNGSIHIPDNALLGTTRMRIAMKWLGNNDITLPLPCTNFQYGEVEDYSIEISNLTLMPCNAPQNAAAQNITHNSATLNWSVPDAPFSVLYMLQYRLLGQTNWQTINNIGNANLPYTLMGLNSNSSYQYRISSDCGNNTVSDFSPTGVFTTLQLPCSIPGSVSASGITNTSVNINWSSVSGAASYQIRYRQQGTSVWQTVSVTGNTQTLAGLVPGTSFEYQLKTICSPTNSSDYTSVYTFTTASGCAMPSALTATVITDNSALITWDTQPDAIAYTVRYRNVNSSSWTYAGAASAFILLPDLLPQTDYEVKVKTLCSVFSSSSYTAALAFTTYATNCATPSGLTADNISSGSATLHWSAVAGAATYTVRYKQTNLSNWTEKTETTNSIALAELAAGVAYEFRVKANCSSSFSDYYTFSTPLPGTCSMPVGLNASSIATTSATLSWTPIPESMGYTVRFRQLASGTFWSVTAATTANKTISWLIPNTAYEFQIRNNCTIGNSGFSPSAAFTTLPTATSCGIPANLTAANITSTQTTLSWAAISGTLGYEIQYTSTGTSTWQLIYTAQNNFVLNNLNECTDYSFKVKAICSPDNSGTFSAPYNFSTLCEPATGTGISILYCAQQGNNATHEWIAGVALADINNTSGSNGGYADFTNLSTDLQAGLAYPITLTPGFSAAAYNEYWRVWIDFNLDGDFDDANELVLDPGSAVNSTLNATVLIPINATGGQTRMRVCMRFKNPANPCGVYSYGETEDYSVEILAANTIEEVLLPIEQPDDCGALQLMPAFEYAVEGTQVSFTNQSEGDYDSIFWSFGDGNFSDEANPTHTYATTGNYFFTLSLQNNSTGCAQNFTGFIHITAGNAATQPNLGDN